jgi:hypothetical protein
MLRTLEFDIFLNTHISIQIHNIQLEAVPWEDLNEDQRKKVERKDELLEEISKLTKRVRQEDFM